MIPNLPTLGIRFDIDKLESDTYDSYTYGFAAWLVFWRAVEISSLAGNTLLFEGDIPAIISGKEYFVYCIVVQSETVDLEAIQSALEQSEEFRSVQASQPFVEAADVVEEPLLEAGRIDSEGNLVGRGVYNTRPALGTVRKERQDERQVDLLSTDVPEREKPASKCTEQLPNISSLKELLDFLFNKLGEENKWQFWLTPEELCDIVEHYANILQVQWYEGSSALSEDLAYVTLFNKGEVGENIALHGLFLFATESDAKDFCNNDKINYSHLIGRLEKLYGIQGRLATNFSGTDGNWVHESSYDKQLDIDAFDLWPNIYRRRQRLGISAP